MSSQRVARLAVAFVALLSGTISGALYPTGAQAAFP